MFLMYSYNGGRDASSFVDFIKSQLLRDEAFARIPELAEVAHKLMEATESERASIIDEAKTAAANVNDVAKENAALYVKYMEKVMAKGPEYVATEMARLQKLVAGGMSPVKMTEMNRKLSILGSFDKNAPEVPAELPEAEDEDDDEEGYGEDGGEEGYGEMLENMGPEGMYINL